MRRLPLTAAICVAFGSMAFAGMAMAQDSDEGQDGSPTLETITVTAQKRTEKAQDVPISLNVIGAQQLDELQVNDFEDYAKLLPSVSITPNGPGFGQVYMRGVASGGDGNHSGPLPSVGIYLDEQPITTIQGALDLHVYDIERVEALSGPQGTLYGASSEAGTLKLVTRKPDTAGFSAGYGLEASTITGGGWGHVAEGFVNIPMGDRAAVRLVGWQKHDAGWVDNVYGERTFPTSGITQNNADRVEDDYNDVDTAGARIALKVDLNDNWTITPTIMGQRQEVNGNFAYDNTLGEGKISHAYREFSDDRWAQAALTLQGKIGNFDLTYAFAHLKRDVDTDSDYSDYGFWYDTLFGYGAYFYDDNGDLVNPAQYIQGKDGYKKTSHELRIASPQENRLRFVAGLFWMDQSHDIQQRYRVDGLASILSVRGWEDTIWLTKQLRKDHDEAIFGELSYDFTDKLTGTVGFRHFRADNSLKGFFGFANGYASQGGQLPQNRYGEAACIVRYGPDPANWPSFEGAPCTVFDKDVSEKDTLGKVNLSYKFRPDKMMYFTWSEGYRPGGINRRGTLPPYITEFLTNYEIGWKTSWFDNRLTFNGAAFHQIWDDFQFPVLGQNGLTEIRNANQARIQGLEMDVNWAASYNLKLSAGVGFYDAELTENYCGAIDANGNPITTCDPADLQAPDGTRLPVTADYKGNLTARYTFDIRDYEAYWQGSVMTEGRRTSDLRILERNILGDLPSYSLVDMAFGVRKNNWSVDLYIKNLLDENAQYGRNVQCPETVCAAQVYTVSGQPRTIGIKFSQEF
ncbi:MAG: TonB-dependent receptor [Lysobacteraceae bacterium]|nr:MAG: TonB-dependent receptor [Xanthomonadaceae bacterium]